MRGIMVIKTCCAAEQACTEGAGMRSRAPLRHAAAPLRAAAPRGAALRRCARARRSTRVPSKICLLEGLYTSPTCVQLTWHDASRLPVWSGCTLYLRRGEESMGRERIHSAQRDHLASTLLCVSPPMSVPGSTQTHGSLMYHTARPLRETAYLVAGRSIRPRSGGVAAAAAAPPAAAGGARRCCPPIPAGCSALQPRPCPSMGAATAISSHLTRCGVAAVPQTRSSC